MDPISALLINSAAAGSGAHEGISDYEVEDAANGFGEDGLGGLDDEDDDGMIQMPPNRGMMQPPPNQVAGGGGGARQPGSREGQGRTRLVFR